MAGEQDGGSTLSEPLGAAWREQAERLQQDGLPDGEVLLSCAAPFGAGGLGRHTRELLEALRRRGSTAACLSLAGERPDGPWPEVRALAPGSGETLLARALAPSPSLRALAGSVSFDRRAARELPGGGHLIAFNGQALAQLRAAREAGYESLGLVAANSHIRHVARRHAMAYRRYPFERSWTGRMIGRTLKEYELAGRIHVSSRYTLESFLAAGVAPERLSTFPLTPDPRYTPAVRGPEGERFEIVYVGSLAVHKGVPLLIDALTKLPYGDIRLTLVGGWGTRGMRVYMQRALAADPRIVVSPGDPLPHLARADLLVHPAYEDGFAYAPAEALACGVPVIVSEDTGMKELIASEREGLVVPTGNLERLTEAIDAAYRGQAPW